MLSSAQVDKAALERQVSERRQRKATAAQRNRRAHSSHLPEWRGVRHEQAQWMWALSVWSASAGSVEPRRGMTGESASALLHAAQGGR